MAEVRMSLEEYLELIREGQITATDVAKSGDFRQGNQVVVKKKKPRRSDPKMAKALREANRRGRTKSGKLRKGYTQARIMSMAHKIRRKM